MMVIQSLLNLLAPPHCLQCTSEGRLLCDECHLDACTKIPSRCFRCKKLTKDFATCDSCIRKTRLRHVWVRTEYNGIAKELIYELKFRSNRSAVKTIASLMDEALPFFTDDNLVITFVPTATTRKRQRGFDHAELIAKELARLRKMKTERVLTRLGQSRQVGAGRELRLKQLDGRYLVRKSIENKTILLIDDIVTTGGTLEAVALALKNAGAKKVYAATFAQK